MVGLTPGHGRNAEAVRIFALATSSALLIERPYPFRHTLRKYTFILSKRNDHVLIPTQLSKARYIMEEHRPTRSAQAQANIDAAMRDSALMFECWKPCDELGVFTVYNSNSKPRKVLAKDAKCAVWLAKSAGHLKDERNGVAAQMPADEVEKLRRNGSALGRAVAGGLPGVVKNVGTSIMLEGRDVVYIPLSIVQT